MRLLFRYDLGGKIGAGHQSRCKLISQYAETIGHEVLKATRADHHGELAGEPSFQLPQNELEQLEQFLKHHPPVDWVMLDHYGYTEHHIQQLQTRLKVKVCVFDDHLARLNANLRWAPFSEAQTPNCLVSEQYAIINAAFFQKHNTDTDTFCHIQTPYNLVCFGTADPDGLTRQFIEQLCLQPKLLEQKWVFIAERQIQITQKLEEFSAFDQIHLYDRLPLSHFISLIKQSQKTLVSTSTVALESLACKANIVGLCYIDNQANIAKWLTDLGVPVFNHIQSIITSIDQLPDKQNIRHQLDNKGPKRLLSSIEAYTG